MTKYCSSCPLSQRFWTPKCVQRVLEIKRTIHYSKRTFEPQCEVLKLLNHTYRFHVQSLWYDHPGMAQPYLESGRAPVNKLYGTASTNRNCGSSLTESQRWNRYLGFTKQLKLFSQTIIIICVILTKIMTMYS